jgi:uncharacterized FlaG/YvyC family protein
MLRENEQTRKMAAQLRANISRITDVLERIHKTLTNQESRLQIMQRKVAEINALNTRLITDVGARYANTINSVILSAREDLKKQLLEWYPDKQWVLLYRATRDGFRGADFHRMCDSKGATCTIIRNGNNIFGGFTPAAWDSSNTYNNASGTTIFTLVNPAGTVPTQYACINPANAIYCDAQYGPTFGAGHDIYICDNSNSNASSYCGFANTFQDTTLRGNTTFTGCYNNWLVNEIEVYQLS